VSRGGSRKDLQLAAQIARSIESTLLGECEDEVLQNLSVEAAPGRRLLVRLLVHAPGSALPREEVLARLEAARPLIVQRAAEDVTRRGLPELSFWLVRAPDSQEASNGGEDFDPPSILDLD
jgi:ribosome-binding factor A